MYQEPTNTCGAGKGSLPGPCAELVFPYIPMQEKNPPVYEKNQALSNGTLFPGLYLPFRKEMAGRLNCDNTPLCELMTLNFAISELGLYLDTHKDDQEAFALFQKYVALFRQGKEKYEKLYGPLQQSSAAEGDSYRWLDDPWPWDDRGGDK